MWKIEGYKSRDFGNLKLGVGVGYDFGEFVMFGRVQVNILLGIIFEFYRFDIKFLFLSSWMEVLESCCVDVGDVVESMMIETISIGSVVGWYWFVWIICLLSDQNSLGFYFSEIL